MTNSEKVLAKAVLATAKKMGLTYDQLAMILGIDLSRTNIDCSKLSLLQKEIALKLIRITVALDSLIGGDISMMQHFMKSPNKITKGIPLDQIQNISELEIVLQFVEGLQAKP
ncbi:MULTISPECIES: antitoxin Xre-like helix-turn-helix domain-containing protein [unclassified Acinetobacter]|uniref:antitoxin Xre-like helix-turn-helix domain-containing protein n=2 Tax=Acinetobacter TaxID=469 RepID=UPI0015D193AA|nr:MULTISPECIES: antitoxin Xre-like helix-turn-helix domain-containing protein [unclassified Acinetobacter]